MDREERFIPSALKNVSLVMVQDLFDGNEFHVNKHVTAQSRHADDCGAGGSTLF